MLQCVTQGLKPPPDVTRLFGQAHLICLNLNEQNGHQNRSATIIWAGCEDLIHFHEYCNAHEWWLQKQNCAEDEMCPGI